MLYHFEPNTDIYKKILLPIPIKLPNHIYNGSRGEGIHHDKKKTIHLFIIVCIEESKNHLMM